MLEIIIRFRAIPVKSYLILIDSVSQTGEFLTRVGIETFIRIQCSKRWHPTSITRCQQLRNSSSLVDRNSKDSGGNGQKTIKSLDLAVGQVVVEVHAGMDIHRQSDHTRTKFLMRVSFAFPNRITATVTYDL